MTAAGDALVASILALAGDLRAAGIDASLAESLDGVRAVDHLGVDQRPVLRAGLQATLVKRPEDVDVFAVLFDRHFPLTSSASAGLPTVGREELAAPSADARNASPDPGRGGLPTSLVDALLAGDDEALLILAADAVADYGGLASTQGGERYVLYRVLRALDLSNLIVAVMARVRSVRPDATPFELRQVRADVRARLEQFRRLLAAEIGRVLPTDPARSGAGLAAPHRLEDLDVASASTTELRRLRSAVRPLARKLASRAGQRRRRHRGGRLDVRRTLRRSLDAGGVPLDAAFRRRRATKPRLVVLCDISGSVAEFAHFTLMLLHALHDELAGLRSFVFVDGVAEVTSVLQRAEVALDPRLLVRLPGVVVHDGHSDYERALRTFVERHGDSLGPATTVLVAGDARTNYRPTGVASLREIRQRCRRLYWFDPDREEEWDDADSALAVYRELCDGVFEVRNLRQLADAVAAIM